MKHKAKMHGQVKEVRFKRREVRVTVSFEGFAVDRVEEEQQEEDERKCSW